METTTVPVRTISRAGFLAGPAYVKLLVSNVVAGSIIGKNGSVIGEIEEKTSVAIKLSGTQQFFPGTSERIVVISGKLEDIFVALSTILDKMRDIGRFSSSSAGEGGSNGLTASNTPSEDGNGNGNSNIGRDDGGVSDNTNSNSKDRACSFKLVVPNSSVPLIIGKGGLTIKAICEDTKARVVVSNRNDVDGAAERTCFLSGSTAEVRAALQNVVTLIQQDTALRDNLHVSYPSHRQDFMQQSPGGMLIAGTGFHNISPYSSTMPIGGQWAGNNNGYQPVCSHETLTAPVEISLMIPNNIIGNIIGKSGNILHEIISISGAKVTISQKTDLINGTDRKVTITGAMRCVHQAHAMIILRMNETAGATDVVVSNSFSNDMPNNSNGFFPNHSGNAWGTKNTRGVGNATWTPTQPQRRSYPGMEKKPVDIVAASARKTSQLRNN